MLRWSGGPAGCARARGNPGWRHGAAAAPPWAPRRRAPHHPALHPAPAAASSSSLVDTSTSLAQQLEHTHLVYELCAAGGHAKEGHPEGPGRIAAIARGLSAARLDSRHHPCVHLLSGAAGSAWDSSSLMAALSAVHPTSYLDRLREICASLREPALVDDSTFLAPGTFDACVQSAGAVLRVLDAVLASGASQGSSSSSSSTSPDRSATMGFALVRPPGHHVLPSRPMGFGAINFMAVAAAHALAQPGVQRVLVLDWDVHHGNGVEEVFFASDAVMYISTHQAGLWPWTGKVTSTGVGQGSGHTINLPLPGGSGGAAMQAAWQRVIAPAARRFQPDLILCSAGFDAHWQDPLAGLNFTEGTYFDFCRATAALAHELCAGRAMWVLEGGYDTRCLAASVAASFAGILGEAGVPGGVDVQALPHQLAREEPLAKVEAVLAHACRIHGL